jgi:hypothetical protein
MDLFDILSNDERIIVLSSADNYQIYTWNQSCTLQCWQDHDDGVWVEVDIRTLDEMPVDFDEARRAAEVWFYAMEESRLSGN